MKFGEIFMAVHAFCVLCFLVLFVCALVWEIK